MDKLPFLFEYFLGWNAQLGRRDEQRFRIHLTPSILLGSTLIGSSQQ